MQHLPPAPSPYYRSHEGKGECAVLSLLGSCICFLVSFVVEFFSSYFCSSGWCRCTLGFPLDVKLVNNLCDWTYAPEVETAGAGELVVMGWVCLGESLKKLSNLECPTPAPIDSLPSPPNFLPYPISFHPLLPPFPFPSISLLPLLCFPVEKHQGFPPKLLSLLLLLERVAMAFIFASNPTGHTNWRRGYRSDRKPQSGQPLARAGSGGRELRQRSPGKGCLGEQGQRALRSLLVQFRLGPN